MLKEKETIVEVEKRIGKSSNKINILTSKDRFRFPSYEEADEWKRLTELVDKNQTFVSIKVLRA